jgi:hypothetical protein
LNQPSEPFGFRGGFEVRHKPIQLRLVVFQLEKEEDADRRPLNGPALSDLLTASMLANSLEA